MKHSLISPLSLLALAALAACGQPKTETVNDTIADPLANQLANAPVAALPPSLKISNKAYRCKGNGLVYLDFFADDVTANIRQEKNGTPIKLTATEKGKPFEGQGYKIEGSGTEVVVTQPGKPAVSCKA